jgi:hypothetical protein
MNAYGGSFGPRISASAFYGDAHEFIGVRITGNKINAGMIYASALKAVFG